MRSPWPGIKPATSCSAAERLTTALTRWVERIKISNKKMFVLFQNTWSHATKRLLYLWIKCAGLRLVGRAQSALVNKGGSFPKPFMRCVKHRYALVNCFWLWACQAKFLANRHTLILLSCILQLVITRRQKKELQVANHSALSVSQVHLTYFMRCSVFPLGAPRNSTISDASDIAGTILYKMCSSLSLWKT